MRIIIYLLSFWFVEYIYTYNKVNKGEKRICIHLYLTEFIAEAGIP